MTVPCGGTAHHLAPSCAQALLKAPGIQYRARKVPAFTEPTLSRAREGGRRQANAPHGAEVEEESVHCVEGRLVDGLQPSRQRPLHGGTFGLSLESKESQARDYLGQEVKERNTVSSRLEEVHARSADLVVIERSIVRRA